MTINFRMSIDDRGMTRVVEASAQEGTVLVKDSPPCFVVSVVKGLERRIDNNASRRNAELDVPWGHGRKPPKEDIARRERAAEFLFKLIMGRLDLITRRVELLEKDPAAKAERINAMFETLEGYLEHKIMKMEADLLTSNSKLVNDSIFAEVKDIISRLPEEVVA